MDVLTLLDALDNRWETLVKITSNVENMKNEFYYLGNAAETPWYLLEKNVLHFSIYNANTLIITIDEL